MAETYYNIPDKPVYNRNIRELQNDDPSNAELTFNPLILQLLENIAAVKELADSALKLAQPRKIGNASFDGSADITLAQIGAAAASHGTHVSYSTDAPKAAGTAAAGSSGAVARSDHVHPEQTNISGNAGTANKLKTARKIGNASFDGSADVTLAQMGAADSGHTHGNMKAATASAAGGAGLVPAPAAGAQAKYLRGDGTWQNPPNTTYGNMTAATASAAGKSGLVPAPAAGAQSKYLRGDGTWQNPPDTNTVYTHPTTAGNKHIPAGGSAGQILKWSAAGTAAWGAAPSQWHHIKKYFELHSSTDGGNNIIGIPLTHVIYVQVFIGNMDSIAVSKTKKECWNIKQDSAGSDSLQIGTVIRDIQCTGIVAPSTSKTSEFAIWYPVKGGVQVSSSLGIGTATPSANTLIFGAHGVNWQIFMIEIWHDGSFAWNSPWN